jgi:phage-related protein
MNYCILNGIKSNTINGLLIQELPPISKPLMRTEIQQVDGRDGDIVTNLGYAAYDKEMLIGLYGDYDIDDVIAYFDSSGTVTFSNEPDKYYNYQIIQKIDYERLARFRQANVVFHVQPFKYSAVGDEASFSTDQFAGLPDYYQTKNGLTISASDGTITIKGTGTSGATEVYLPINPISLKAGSYTLAVTATGSGASACPMRLIGDVPSNADSFGGNYLSLQNDGTAYLSATLTQAKTFNFIWFYISAGTAISLTLDVSVLASDVSSMSLVNHGNTTSRPTIQVIGSGTIDLLINGNQVLTLSLGDLETITIDATAMNAYQGELLANRAVTGDYEDVVLSVGTNTLSWSGDVESVIVTGISRWI